MRLASKLGTLALIAITGFAFAQPALAWEDSKSEDDDFWEEEKESIRNVSGVGSGGGPLMMWYEQDLSVVNDALAAAGLLAVPEQDLYWGGAGWGGVTTTGPLSVAIGGGGFGGAAESQRSNDYSSWTLGGGYFAAKGIYPLHRMLYIEGGVQLGGGMSSMVVERTNSDTGIVEVHLRGDRPFAMARGSLGVDIRLADWAGILVEGGYSYTSGSWKLVGDSDLVGGLEIENDASPYASVMVRFGI